MNAIRIIRVAEAKNSTLSHLYIGGRFCCYLLEDRIRAVKIAGETCIPAGHYRLRLNPWAGMNAKYETRLPRLHEGMVEIIGIPDFKLVFLHMGNYHHETRGCPLTGAYGQLHAGDYRVLHSAAAYKHAYPQLVAQVKAGNDRIIVENAI